MIYIATIKPTHGYNQHIFYNPVNSKLCRCLSHHGNIIYITLDSTFGFYDYVKNTYIKTKTSLLPEPIPEIVPKNKRYIKEINEINEIFNDIIFSKI